MYALMVEILYAINFDGHCKPFNIKKLTCCSFSNFQQCNMWKALTIEEGHKWRATG